MIPELDRFYREQGTDYGFLAIARAGTASQASQYVQGAGYDFPVLIDPDNSIWAGYDVGPSSATVFIDSQGMVVTVTDEVMTASEMILFLQGMMVPPFADVGAGHPYAVAIYDLESRGVINGFPDGTFRPDDMVTRQQFAKMIVKSLGLPVSTEDICPFRDVQTSTPGSYVDPSDPDYPDHYVAVCAAQGITEGKTLTTFAPFENLSRAQLITMVARAAHLADPPDYYSPPFGKFDQTHYPFARRAAYEGLLAGLQGIGPGYDFFSPANRGEVCMILHSLNDLLEQ